MGILSYGKMWWLSIFLLFLTGCSTFESSVFFVPEDERSQFHAVERSDWVTKNQGYGSIRPSLKMINISGESLTIYPILCSGYVGAFGPPFLPIIWIPEFLSLPPLDPLNELHLVYTGNIDELGIESVDGVSVSKKYLKKRIQAGEAHLYLVIPDDVAKGDIFSINLIVKGNAIKLNFKKVRSKNWHPLFVPL